MECPILIIQNLPTHTQGNYPLQMREGTILCMEAHPSTHTPSLDVRLNM